MSGRTNALDRYEHVSYLPRCEAIADVAALLIKGTDGLYYVPIGGDLYHVYQSPQRMKPTINAYQLVMRDKPDQFIAVVEEQGQVRAVMLSDKSVRNLKSGFRLYRG